VRFAGLALLGLAVGKVFVVDLAALASLWRVASFLLLGLLLLAGAFVYQRMRKEPRLS
jgi:LPXTG-motif cell wall-anchored protein